MDAARFKELETAVKAEYGDDAKIVHVSQPFDGKCDHDFQGIEPDDNSSCVKCGISFLRYAHCYMP